MFLRIALIGQVWLLAGPVGADAARFRTAQGVDVGMPAVESLSCLDLRGVLRVIDRSQYRVGGSMPKASADLALHAYESRVWTRYYTECVVATGASAGAASTFVDGFDGAEAMPE